MESTFYKTVKNSINHWYLILIAGLIFVVLGIWTLLTPVSTYLTLSVIFSVSFVIIGFIEIIFAISNRKEIDSWGWNLVNGILNLLVGLLLISNPAISILTLPVYVGFIVLFRSIMAIGTSLDLQNYELPDSGSLLIIGILGIIFSFILIWNPGFAGLSLAVWTSIALITAGVYSISFSLKLKKLHNKVDKISNN